jgi:hypothetical protein
MEDELEVELQSPLDCPGRAESEDAGPGSNWSAL